MAQRHKYRTLLKLYDSDRGGGYPPQNIRVACKHAGLTHFGGAFFFSRIYASAAVAQFRSHDRTKAHRLPSRAFAAKALDLEIVCLAYNLVTLSNERVYPRNGRVRFSQTTPPAILARDAADFRSDLRLGNS